MPCYSSIKTKITNGALLVAALRATGYGAAVLAADGLSVSTASGARLFERASVKDGFSSARYSSNLGPADVAKIGRAYAEQAVRSWAASRSYGVAVEGQTLTLTSRRG